MAILPIVKLPDSILRARSAPIERVDTALKRLISDMFTTMYEAPGVGLAAVQVGVPRRLLVIDIVKGEDEIKQPIAMINPEVVGIVGDAMRTYEEGCLSIPDIYAEVERPNEVRVRYTTPEGQTVERICEGMLATVVQHEIDHLDGKLFIDYLSRLKRDVILKKINKAKREVAPV